MQGQGPCAVANLEPWAAALVEGHPKRAEGVGRGVGRCRAYAPFDPVCAARTYVPDNGAASWDTLGPEETVEPGRCTCRPHPLGTWPDHGGPGGSYWSPSGSPPRSWPPWWPRPPCYPRNPHRHTEHPGLRCPPSQLSPHAPPRPSLPPHRNPPPRLLRHLAARTSGLQP
jgi:hypothetical protein